MYTDWRESAEELPGDELLHAQDTVLCSYFAQRMGTKNDGWGQKGNGEEIFQGLERFE